MKHEKLVERTIQSALKLILSDFSKISQEENSPELIDSGWFEHFFFQINTKGNGKEFWRIEENSEPADNGSYYIRLLYENERNKTFTYYKCDERLPFSLSRSGCSWSANIEKGIPIPKLGDQSYATRGLYLYPKLYKGKPANKQTLFDHIEHGDSVLMEGRQEAFNLYSRGRSRGFHTVMRSQGNSFYRVWFLTA